MERIKHKQSYKLSSLMTTPTVLGIYGPSDSGKTTLMVRLVSQLTKEGIRVATIKQTNKDISMDTTGKDTWRHHEAGAALVVFSSRCETNFLFHEELSVSEIIRRMSLFGEYDLVLVEGADDPCVPKIQLGSCKRRINTIATYNGNRKEILTLIKQSVHKNRSLQHLMILVNGKKIPLTEFPEKIISNTIIGMLGALKGVTDINEVSIELKQIE